MNGIGVVEPSFYALYSYNITSINSLIYHMNQFLSNLPIPRDKNYQNSFDLNTLKKVQ